MPHDRWISQIRPVGKERYQIICESEEPLILYRSEMLQYGIAEDTVLSSETYEKLCEEVFRKRASSRCLYLLEKQDYTEFQIRQKLKEGCIPEDIIDETVQWLCQIHALDDRRYTESYLRANARRYSRRVLTEKLKARGIDPQTTDEVMQEDPDLKPDEARQIAEWLKKKHYDPETAGWEDREKMRQALSRRGFDTRMIRKMT